MPTAPVILFVYNRPEHTRRTLEALQQNKLADQSDLYIYADAAKDSKAEAEVCQVRDLIKTVSGFRTVTIIEREKNWGLANSIVDGVSTVIAKHGTAIVLEDDLVTSPHFLTYMNEGLHVYTNVASVMHINGYCPPIDTTDIKDDTFFYRVTSSWGWATWADRWQMYNNNAASLLDDLRQQQLLDYFDIDGTFRYSSTLRANIRGDIQTWAIKWYACVTLKKGLCLYPKHSLVTNIGNDGTGSNAQKDNNFDTLLYTQEVPVVQQDIAEKPAVQLRMKQYYQRIRPNWFYKLSLRLHLLRKKI